MNQDGRWEKTAVLQVGGLVQNPANWAPSDLAGLTDQITGEAGQGVSVRALLDKAGPEGGFVSVESSDGSYRASIPIEELSSKGVLVYGWEGGTLPTEKGGPFRMLVPDGRTLCWNVKGVGQLRVTAQPEPDSVPANPTH